MDASGLGNQTRELVRMLNPHKILAIDSTNFRPGLKQFPEWYKDYPNVKYIEGFPTETDLNWLMDDVDGILTAETPYRYILFSHTQQRGIKTFLQYNYEFFEYFQKPNYRLPTQLLAPADWNTLKVFAHTRKEPVLLRPPLNMDDFKAVREVNLNREGKRRFLHVVGKQAAHDRNGTDTLLRMLKITDADFELVIKSQDPLPFPVDDPRVIFDYSSPEENSELYRDFDAMIMPRKYGGLCLPMNEALASGLPVLMTDIEPNNKILPMKWLARANKKGSFYTRTNIDIYEANVIQLVSKVERLISISPEQMKQEKQEAYELAQREFSYESLLPKYLEVFSR